MATGTYDMTPKNLSLRQIVAEHYDQGRSYIDRMQANIPYGTVRKTLSITEHLHDI
ncbi:MAG: hypothetical protein Q4B86_06955 [Eubacteriales bacterium]|nr:hypothetical protein [Eubacteriales bacterium]